MTKYSSLASVRATRERLEELGLSTRKSLGQHFLIDDGVVGKIIRLADITPDNSIIEVGPGIGTLTEALLAANSSIVAVEVDAALAKALEARFSDLHVLGGDALDSEIISKVVAFAPDALVANLPYAVAATIILEYFQRVPSLKSATVMVQKEVADRIAAEPGRKEYGSYTIKLQLLAEVKDQFGVSPQCFFPPPRVDSSVVRLERRTPALGDTPLLTTASMLADAAFFQRRKTLSNSLGAYFAAHGLNAQLIGELLSQAGVEPGVRGETLRPDVFLEMSRIWSELSETPLH